MLIDLFKHECAADDDLAEYTLAEIGKFDFFEKHGLTLSIKGPFWGKHNDGLSRPKWPDRPNVGQSTFGPEAWPIIGTFSFIGQG